MASSRASLVLVWALMSNNYIEWMHVDDVREIGRRIMLDTLRYGIRENKGSSPHPLGMVLWTSMIHICNITSKNSLFVLLFYFITFSAIITFYLFIQYFIGFK